MGTKSILRKNDTSKKKKKAKTQDEKRAESANRRKNQKQKEDDMDDPKAITKANTMTLAQSKKLLKNRRGSG